MVSSCRTPSRRTFRRNEPPDERVAMSVKAGLKSTRPSTRRSISQFRPVTRTVHRRRLSFSSVEFEEEDVSPPHSAEPVGEGGAGGAGGARAAGGAGGAGGAGSGTGGVGGRAGSERCAGRAGSAAGAGKVDGAGKADGSGMADGSGKAGRAGGVAGRAGMAGTCGVSRGPGAVAASTPTTPAPRTNTARSLPKLLAFRSADALRIAATRRRTWSGEAIASDAAIVSPTEHRRARSMRLAAYVDGRTPAFSTTSSVACSRRAAARRAPSHTTGTNQ